MNSQISPLFIANLGLVITLILSSCSLEKRRYLSGYHVEWHSKKDKSEMAVKSPSYVQEDFSSEAKERSENLEIIRNNSDDGLANSQDILPSANKVENNPDLGREDDKSAIQDVTSEGGDRDAKLQPMAKMGRKSSGGGSKTEGFGLAAFIIALVSLFLPPLLLIALIFSLISLGRFRRNPGKFKGKGFAITALVLGLLAVVGLLIALSL